MSDKFINTVMLGLGARPASNINVFQNAQRYCTDIQNSKDGWVRCLGFAAELVNSGAPQPVVFFCLQTVSQVLDSDDKYAALGPGQCTQFRDLIKSFLAAVVSKRPQLDDYIRVMIGVILGRMVWRQFPDEWGSLFQDVLGSLSKGGPLMVDIFLQSLKCIDEEIVQRTTYYSNTDGQRAHRIKDTMRRTCVKDITQFLLSVASQCAVTFPQLAAKALHVFSMYVAWIPIELSTNENVLLLLYNLVANLHKDSGGSERKGDAQVHVQVRVNACIVLQEIVSKKVLDKAAKLELLVSTMKISQFLRSLDLKALREPLASEVAELICLVGMKSLEIRAYAGKRLKNWHTALAKGENAPKDYNEHGGSTEGQPAMRPLTQSQCLEVMARAGTLCKCMLEFAYQCFAHDEFTVAMECVDFIRMYIQRLRRVRETHTKCMHHRNHEAESSEKARLASLYFGACVCQQQGNNNTLPFCPLHCIAGGDQAHVKHILQVLAVACRFPSWYRLFEEGNSGGDAERDAAFREFRSHLHAVYGNVAQLDAEVTVSTVCSLVDAALQAVSHKANLSQRDAPVVLARADSGRSSDSQGRAGWAQLECALHWLYLLGENVPKAHRRLQFFQRYPDVLRTLNTVFAAARMLSSYPHVCVSQQWFQLVDRFGPSFLEAMGGDEGTNVSQITTCLTALLTSFLGPTGIGHSVVRVRRVASYFLPRFLRECRTTRVSIASGQFSGCLLKLVASNVPQMLNHIRRTVTPALFDEDDASSKNNNSNNNSNNNNNNSNSNNNDRKTVPVENALMLCEAMGVLVTPEAVGERAPAYIRGIVEFFQNRLRGYISTVSGMLRSQQISPGEMSPKGFQDFAGAINRLSGDYALGYEKLGVYGSRCVFAVGSLSKPLFRFGLKDQTSAQVHANCEKVWSSFIERVVDYTSPFAVHDSCAVAIMYTLRRFVKGACERAARPHLQACLSYLLNHLIFTTSTHDLHDLIRRDFGHQADSRGGRRVRVDEEDKKLQPGGVTLGDVSMDFASLLSQMVAFYKVHMISTLDEILIPTSAHLFTLLQKYDALFNSSCGNNNSNNNNNNNNNNSNNNNNNGDASSHSAFDHMRSERAEVLRKYCHLFYCIVNEGLFSTFISSRNFQYFTGKLIGFLLTCVTGDKHSRRIHTVKSAALTAIMAIIEALRVGITSSVRDSNVGTWFSAGPESKTGVQPNRANLVPAGLKLDSSIQSGDNDNVLHKLINAVVTSMTRTTFQLLRDTEFKPYQDPQCVSIVDMLIKCHVLSARVGGSAYMDALQSYISNETKCDQDTVRAYIAPLSAMAAHQNKNPNARLLSDAQRQCKKWLTGFSSNAHGVS